MNERFLRLPEVMETVGLRRTAIYDKITRGEFPAPVKIGSVSVWLASEISAYIGVHPSPPPRDIRKASPHIMSAMDSNGLSSNCRGLRYSEWTGSDIGGLRVAPILPQTLKPYSQIHRVYTEEHIRVPAWRCVN